MNGFNTPKNNFDLIIQIYKLHTMIYGENQHIEERTFRVYTSN